MQKFGLRDRVAYLAGDFANDLLFVLVSAWLMVYYTDCLALPPLAVGVLFVVARVWDALADLGAGLLVDRSRPDRTGKFRPWLRRFALPLCLATLCCFTDPAGPGSGLRLAWAWLGYLAWGSLYSLVNIPYGSLASVMTDKPAERTALSTWRTVGAVLANVAVAVLAPLLVFGPDRQPRAAGFLVLAALLATLAGLSYYLCWRGATERISAGPRDAADRHPIGIGTIAKGLLGNRNLVALSLASILLISINLYLGALQPYLFKDFFHAPELLSFIPLALAPSLLLLILTAQPLANRFGKKELACVGLGLALVADVQLYVLPMPFPALYLAWQALATLGIGYFSFLTWALVADVIDQHARDTGLRREATVYAVFSLSRKLGQALAGGLGALALSLAGYQSGQAGQSVETAEKLRSLVTFYPLIGTALMALILGFFYRLDRRTVHILHPGA